MQLVNPNSEHLPAYVAALKRGFQPDNMNPASCELALAQIEQDPQAFLEKMDTRSIAPSYFALPDGSHVARIPGFVRWIWDGEFCGSIGFRYQVGTEALPPHCLGHIGYAVVEWKRRKGYATAALKQLLPEAKALGMRYVQLTTQPENIASQRVILAAGGRFVESFQLPAQYLVDETEWRYQIDLH